MQRYGGAREPGLWRQRGVPEKEATQEIGSIPMEKALCEVKGFDMPLPGPGPRFPGWHLFLNACLLGFCGADWSNLWEKKRKHQESS